MKISDLKQPYRRMAEYLAEKNTHEHYKNKEVLQDAFMWVETDYKFWNEVISNNYPPITEEIKKHFPDDFDFSGDKQPIQLPDNPIIQNRIYTQLAKEGKFDELPDTCEFSEPVELEVSDFNGVIVKKTNVVGRFKSKFVEKEDTYTVGYIMWNYAQLPTPKIEFSEFKAGDVVEVEYYGDEGYDNIVGYIYELNDYSIHISSKMSDLGDYEIILKQNIKTIIKIK